MIRRSSGTHAGKPSAQHSKHLKSSTSVFPSSTLNSFRMTSWFSTCCTLASVQFHSANLAYTKLVRLNLRTMWSWNLKMFFVGSFCGWEKPLCLFLFHQLAAVSMVFNDRHFFQGTMFTSPLLIFPLLYGYRCYYGGGTVTFATAGASDSDVIAPYQGSTSRLCLWTASVSSPMTDGRASKIKNLIQKHFSIC